MELAPAARAGVTPKLQHGTGQTVKARRLQDLTRPVNHIRTIPERQTVWFRFSNSNGPSTFTAVQDQLRLPVKTVTDSDLMGSVHGWATVSIMQAKTPSDDSPGDLLNLAALQTLSPGGQAYALKGHKTPDRRRWLVSK